MVRVSAHRVAEKCESSHLLDLEGRTRVDDDFPQSKVVTQLEALLRT